MPPEGDLNPYAAPQSNVAPPKVQEPSLPRPASTKWLLALMWFVVVGCTVICYFDEAERGPEFFDAVKSLRFVSFVSVIVVIMVAFHAFKRSRITYALGVLYLLFFGFVLWIQVSGTVRRFVSNWNQQIDRTQSNADLFVALLFAALFTKLCYNFIFGLHSRRFYRLTQK